MEIKKSTLPSPIFSAFKTQNPLLILNEFAALHFGIFFAFFIFAK